MYRSKVNYNKVQHKVPTEKDIASAKRKEELSETYSKTIQVAGHIDTNQNYQFFQNYLIKSYLPPQNVIPDPNLDVAKIEIKGDWKQDQLPTIDPKITHQNVYLLTKETKIVVPEARSTPENLAYYRCQLIAKNETFAMCTPTTLVIKKVNSGKNYVNEYLHYDEYGGGCYLKCHAVPHFFSLIEKAKGDRPVDYKPDGGCLILCRRVGKKKYHLSAFRVPIDHGIYIPPFTLHSDDFIMGNYLTIDTMVNQDCSAIIKSKEKITEVKIDAKFA